MVKEYCSGFCQSGSQEAIKGAVHASAGAIAAVMAAYNLAACCFRRDRHLKINAVVYTLAVAWEVKQTLHHLERRARVPQRHEPASPARVEAA